ncbi:hypothetical protein ACFVLG_36045, partial [Streptomyces rochei]|uniref:hypothetical protein n=3 Tax=Streptomyces TaxID=1883 RepID=UPI0036C35271
GAGGWRPGAPYGMESGGALRRITSQISGVVTRFIEGPEAHDRTDRLAHKYLGSERFEWTMPGEQRVAVIVRPVKVRHIVGVERFRPGGPRPAS